VATLIAWVIKVILFLGAARKLWGYMMDTNIAQIILFVVEAQKAVKRHDNKRNSDPIQRPDFKDGGRVRDNEHPES